MNLRARRRKQVYNYDTEIEESVIIDVIIVGFTKSQLSLDACNRLSGGATEAIIIENNHFNTCNLYELIPIIEEL
jgi:hypothetical protein